MVSRYADLPYILRRGPTLPILMAATFVFTYGGIVGVWYFYGRWVGVAAFGIRIAISRVSFMYYFNREVREHAEWEYRQMQEDRSNANVPLEELDEMDRMARIITPGLVSDVATMDESELKQEAYRRAREAVTRYMRRG
jgi:hypothetical protein